jgi:hypothetical protein
MLVMLSDFEHPFTWHRLAPENIFKERHDVVWSFRTAKRDQKQCLVRKRRFFAHHN